MGKLIAERLTVFLDALETLRKGVDLYYEYEVFFAEHSTKRNEELLMSMRDSMIQRFEYCTDLFWKLVKTYLEDIEKLDVEINSPRGILREAVKARVLSESEGNECINMVESRNRTSHIYHEPTADKIAKHVPDYYRLLKDITERIQGRILEQR